MTNRIATAALDQAAWEPLVIKRHGFTLIELLVVIAIIAVLIALAVARGAGGTRSGSTVAMPQ